MNLAHALVCSSGWWARTAEHKLLPWGLAEVDLGDEVLEVGPGFGATTRVLARRSGSLTVVELSVGYCERLGRTLGDDVEVAAVQRMLGIPFQLHAQPGLFHGNEDLAYGMEFGSSLPGRVHRNPRVWRGFEVELWIELTAECC